VAGTVHVEPAGVDIVVEDGETILHAAERQGYRWPTICHGQAICTTCFFEVTAGGDDLDPPGPVEEQVLRTLPGSQLYEGHELRLACQVRLRSDLSARKRGVRPM
jgi:ferredoxin, 2Fe-2S